jgi:hypothetical protein
MKKYCLLLLTVILISCKKEDSNRSLNTQISGKWELQSYGGGLDGRIFSATPDSVYLVFMPNQTYNKIVKGQLKEKGTYQLGHAKSIYSGQMDNAIKLGNTGMWNIVVVNNDTLSISSNAYDGGGASYIKK